MKISDIQNQIIDHFFGETRNRHDTNIQSVISCASLDELIQARLKLSQEDLDLIFQQCAARDTLSSRFNPRECSSVFIRLKTVSLNSDFI